MLALRFMALVSSSSDRSELYSSASIIWLSLSSSFLSPSCSGGMEPASCGGGTLSPSGVGWGGVTCGVCASAVSAAVAVMMGASAAWGGVDVTAMGPQSAPRSAPMGPWRCICSTMPCIRSMLEPMSDSCSLSLALRSSTRVSSCRGELMMSSCVHSSCATLSRSAVLVMLSCCSCRSISSTMRICFLPAFSLMWKRSSM